MKLISEIKSDYKAINRKCNFLFILRDLLFSYNVRPLILLRLRNVPIIKYFSVWFLRVYYMIEYNPNIIIGYSLRLPHPRGIILSAESIGNNCFIGQWVTIGGNNCKTREINGKIISRPIIKDNVQIYAGSVVAGPIIISNEVIIGANTTITKDVNKNSLYYNANGVSKKSVTVPGYKGAFYYNDDTYII